MEDCCAVCAEPLEWTAYGPCGHTEACSKCVMRLRFVMDDKRCVICQQINPCVLVTRFMGSYTTTLPSSEFPNLGRRPGMDYLASTQAYFDDKQHFDEIRGLCSFSHPELKDDNGQMLVFRAINQLKRQLADTKNVQLCNICVENRKVFIPEQVAYSKPELERHMRTGDLTGPMAESGFKGHPQCRFCRSRFFSDSELFIHMQSAHEQCFLCRRAHPDRFIYYKDYNELEDHFRHEHYLCNHQLCLDRKFIVFMTEHELKQHAAREHGGDMSKAERRQALTIPINFQYSHGAEAAGGSSGRIRHESGVPGSITIGGSGDVRSRFALRAPREDHHHLSSAIHASVESLQTEDALRVSAAATSSATDPTPAEAEGAAFSGPRHYLAAAGSRGGGNLRAEDFPALPGISKSAKKRSNQKQRLGGQRSTSDSDLAGSIANALAQSSSTPNFQEDEVVVREPEWQEVRAPAQRQLAQQQRLSKLQGRAAAAAASDGAPALRPEAADSFPPINGGARSASSSQTVSPPAADHLPASNGVSPAAPGSSAREAFPSLGPSATSARQRNLRSWGPGSSAAPEQRVAPQKHRSQAEHFPMLGKMAASSGRPPAPQPSATVSDSAKAANKALLKQIKAQLSEEQLTDFRREASNFLQGDIDAPSYHELVVSLGLGAMVPEMAALLPDEDRRAELLSAHSAAQQAERNLAGDAAAAHAMQFGSWTCNRCSLMNGPDTRSCEACNSKRPQGSKHSSSNGSAQHQDAGQPHEDDFPSMGLAQASGSSGNPNENEGKQQRKGKKVSKFERLRLTGGDPEATLAWMDTEGGRKPPTNPQNQWTQGRPAVSAGLGGSQPKGQWSRQGKLAHEIRTVQDAWSKK